MSDDHTMTRAEFDAMREGATPFWYGGDQQTIVSFSAQPDGMTLTLTSFETEDHPQMSTLIPWGEFFMISGDLPFMLESGRASRRAGKSVHVSTRTCSGGV